METKVCSHCEKLKPVSEFNKKQTRCKDCIKEYDKEYRKRNADKIKEYHKKNADKIKEYYKEYYRQNADKIKERKKEYDKEYRKRNADKIKEYHKKNADKIKERKKEYFKQNLIRVNGTQININTAPEEIKPLIKIAIDSRNKILETKNKLKGDAQHGQKLNVESC